MACDAMFKKKGVTLDLIRDPAMYEMIESAMSRGICMINKRYAKANREMVGEYNPEQPKTNISEWDPKNLY